MPQNPLLLDFGYQELCVPGCTFRRCSGLVSTTSWVNEARDYPNTSNASHIAERVTCQTSWELKAGVRSVCLHLDPKSMDKNGLWGSCLQVLGNYCTYFWSPGMAPTESRHLGIRSQASLQGRSPYMDLQPWDRCYMNPKPGNQWSTL